MQTGRFAVVRWIDNIITSLTMLTLALLFLVALATAAGTHVLQLRLESWHYDCHFGDWVDHLRSSRSRPATNALQRRLVTHTRLGFRRYVTVGPPTGSFARLSNLPNTYRARGNVGPGAADGRADPTTDMRGRGASGARTGSRCRQRGPAGAASTKPTAKTRTCCRCAQPTSADCRSTTRPPAWPPPVSTSWGIQHLRAASKPPQPIWVRTSFTTCTPRRSKPRSATANCSRWLTSIRPSTISPSLHHARYWPILRRTRFSGVSVRRQLGAAPPRST